MSSEAEGGRGQIEELIKSLRDAIMELRGLVDEISNPVVPTQLKPKAGGARGGDHSGGSGGGEAKAPRPEGSAATGAPEGAGVPAGGGGDTGAFPAQAKSAVEGIAEMLSRPKGAGGRWAGGAELSLERLAGLLRLIYELESKVPSEYLEGLVEVLYKSGLIDDLRRDAVKRIIELARIGLEHGLSPDESVAILAALSKELGLDVAEITEELVKAIIQRRGAVRWESQQ